MTLTDQLLAVATAYQAATSAAETTVSWHLFEETRTLRGLRDGSKSVTLTRAQKAIQKASDNWPEGADWPAGVPRPDRMPAPQPEPAQ